MEWNEPTFRVDAIRELMDREGLDASGFATRVWVTRTLIGAWLSGVVVPQVGTITRMCKAFNVPIEFFFTTKPAMESAQDTEDNLCQ